MTLKLEDIVPRPSSFTLSNGKVYHLRAVTLGDEVWMAQEFGGEKLRAIFDRGEMLPICRIVFRLLSEEDKAEFAKQTVTIMNEEGDSMQETLGGYRLLYTRISGFSEKQAVLTALLETLGISRPTLEKIEAAMVEDAEKKSLSLPTGATPSTP